MRPRTEEVKGEEKEYEAMVVVLVVLTLFLANDLRSVTSWQLFEERVQG